MFDMRKHRRKVDYNGGFSLSIIAGEMFYSTPRRTVPFEEYTALEVAVLGPAKEPIDTVLGKLGSHLYHPSEAGVNGFDDIFEDGNSPVAAYVPVAKVEALVKAFTEKFGQPTSDKYELEDLRNPNPPQE